MWGREKSCAILWGECQAVVIRLTDSCIPAASHIATELWRTESLTVPKIKKKIVNRPCGFFCDVRKPHRSM